MAERVRARGGILTVGGDVALARALGADGVHLGGGAAPAAIAAARAALGAEALIGVSAHAPHEVATAAAGRRRLRDVSPIFRPRASRATGRASARRASGRPWPRAPGGGTGRDGPERGAACRSAGAAAFAVMGGLMRAANPEAATRLFLDAWDGRNVASNLEASARQAGSGCRQTGEGP